MNEEVTYTSQPHTEYAPTQRVVKPKSNIVQFAIATLVVIPSLFFWVLILLFGGIFVAVILSDDTSATCTVARIPIHGVMTTTDAGFSQFLEFAGVVSSDGVIENINSALEDESIEAILLDIDSPGGTPVSADEIMTALQASTKPTLSVIRDIGTSAAYWAAAGTDHIIASPISDVGSIGVTMSYLESASSTDTEGSKWIDLSSGLFKDAGHPERKLREEEEVHFQGQVDTIHTYMVDRIAQARKGRVSKEALTTLSDGRAYLGLESLELGLIDEVGGFDEAVAYVAGVLSKTTDEVTICPPMTGGLGDFF